MVQSKIKKKAKEGIITAAVTGATLLPSSCVRFNSYESDSVFETNKAETIRKARPRSEFRVSVPQGVSGVEKQCHENLLYMVEATEKSEGFRPDAYFCGAWTIGIGSCYYEDGTRVKKGDPDITYERALGLVAAHYIRRVFPMVSGSLRKKVSDNELVAVCMYVYADGVRGQKVINAINAGRPMAECLRLMTASNKIRDEKGDLQSEPSKSLLQNRWYIGAIGTGALALDDISGAPGCVHNAKANNLFASMTANADGTFNPKYDNATMAYFFRQTGMGKGGAAKGKAAEIVAEHSLRTETATADVETPRRQPQQGLGEMVMMHLRNFLSR